MPNTGNQIFTGLKEVDAPCPPPYTGCTCVPGCPTKPNEISDPDYINPIQNLVACPISFTTDCPTLVATGQSTSIVFEFSLANAVVLNPAIATIKIKAMLASVEQDSVSFSLPNATPNYFFGSLTGLISTTAYDIEIDYLDSGSSVVDNCPLGTISTT